MAQGTEEVLMVPVRWVMASLVAMAVMLIIWGIATADWVKVAGAGLFAVFWLLFKWLFRR